MAEMITPTSRCIEEEISGNITVVGKQAIGEDVTLNLVIRNMTTKSKVITADIKVYSILYTRKEINELHKETRNIKLRGCEEREEPLTITYAQYDGLLTADNAIEVTFVCSYEPVVGTLIIQTNIVLDNPKFEIKIKEPVHMNKPVNAEVVFTNPLNQVVSDIVVTAEGSGLLRDPITVKGGSVKPNETIKIPLTITPYKFGSKHLLVDLNSDKFKNAKGFIEVEVHKPAEKNSASSI
ncbi:protein-glutamine gamma-glutamyltransferase E-like [Rana temporaria]|uniref:protein-glutamine gamma-glutamyltransferase E-like n=1 Tax=Rana temporaria TaxID=8407 RepID=UPI001AAD020B|nr:protein-glutamine gamma-glutamyltransferase E-like [Rana temporaria]XP_040186213.1 protein-glutamine gamma-glutamyltransferase E-like [Rana temporaria]